MRQLLAGGDVLSPAHVRRVQQAHPACRVINGYGPTENTTFSCCHTVPGAWPTGSTVPIGRPIANSRAYVLDSSFQPVPVGVPGELCVAGDGLARGYLRRPDLTAERFVPDPWSDAPGSRLYRTGDLARLCADGTIEFLGRRDRQVKIRGFRVEPGEIEAVLESHPSVRHCTVQVVADAGLDKRLVAYVVSAADPPPRAEALRAFLSERLPDHMVPGAFVFLERLPLTGNGKVDRRALPPPPELGSSSTAEYEPPAAGLEEAVASTWRDVLGVSRLGRHDNFFELGGHSLSGARLITRLADNLRVLLDVRALFEAPTVARMATRISELVADRARGHADELARIEDLSEEEAERLLAEQRSSDVRSGG